MPERARGGREGPRTTSSTWRAILACGLFLSLAALGAFPHAHPDVRTERQCPACHLFRPGGVALPAADAVRVVAPATTIEVVVEVPVPAASARRPDGPLRPRSPPPSAPSSAA